MGWVARILIALVLVLGTGNVLYSGINIDAATVLLIANTGTVQYRSADVIRTVVPPLQAM